MSCAALSRATLRAARRSPPVLTVAVRAVAELRDASRRRKQKATKDDTPGPAAYAAPPLLAPSGGKFNTSKPKSDIDWVTYRAAQLPAPGQCAYSRASAMLKQCRALTRSSNTLRCGCSPCCADGAPALPKPAGGRFSTAFPKTELDWIVYRARENPGPAVYGAPKLPTPSGGRFNESNPKGELDWIEYRARQLPAPGDHDVDRGVMLLSKTKPSPAFSLRGKVVRGNHQTQLPDAVSFTHSTANPEGPGRCRTDSFLDDKQLISRYKRVPVHRFSSGSRGLDPFATDKRKPTKQERKAARRAARCPSDYERYFGFQPKGISKRERGRDPHAKRARRKTKRAAAKRRAAGAGAGAKLPTGLVGSVDAGDSLSTLGSKRSRASRRGGARSPVTRPVRLPASPHDPPGVGAYDTSNPGAVALQTKKPMPAYSFGYSERPPLNFA